MEIGEKVIIALVVIIAIAAIVGVAIGVPMVMGKMREPESCAKTCHEMQPFYNSLQESPHAGADCHECHKAQGPEVFLLMGHALHHAEGMAVGKSYEEMAEEIEEKPPASPKKEYCMECHGEHKKPSEKISKFDISCFKCHSAIKHTEHPVEKYRAYESPNYSGYECVACHDDHDMKVEEETCRACHPPGRHP